MFVDDNPDANLDEVLAHFGVLGMKWGHRKPADAHEIRSARARLTVQQNRYESARRSVKKAKSPAGKAAARDKMAHVKSSFLKNPDRVTAVRMTRGEKAVALLLTLPTGGLAGVAAIGATSAMSRRIEYKQQNGGYNNK